MYFVVIAVIVVIVVIAVIVVMVVHANIKSYSLIYSVTRPPIELSWKAKNVL